MANVKISDLPTASTPLSGTELVPIVQSGITSQTTVDQVNAVLAADLSANSGSSLVGFLQSGTNAVATTVQTKLREIVNVDDFIPVGTNTATTDCQTYIQAALDYAATIKTSVNFCKGTYKCNSGLTFYPNTVAIQGNGAILDFSAMTTGYAISFSQSSLDANERNALNKAHPIDSLYITGPGGTVSVTAIKGIDQNPLSGPSYWLSGVTFRNCAFMNFYRDVEFGNGSFLFTFLACNFHITGGTGYDVSILVQSAANSGENHEFISCYWGSKKVIQCLNGNASIYFKGCSADYMPIAFDVQGGMVDWDGYIENNTDTNYWGSVTGENSLLRIAGEIAITDNKSAYECFYCDSTSTNGGLLLDINLQIAGGVTYTPPSRNLVAGTGRIVCSLRAQSKNTVHPVIGEGNNILAYGNFESANYTADWTLINGAIRSNVQKRNGTYSLSFPAAIGVNPQATRAIACKPGQQLVGGAWYLAPAFTGSGATFYATLTYQDASGNSLSQANVLNISSNVSTWTYFSIYQLTPAPKGTVTALVSISVFGMTGGAPIGYIDDIILNVV